MKFFLLLCFWWGNPGGCLDLAYTLTKHYKKVVGERPKILPVTTKCFSIPLFPLKFTTASSNLQKFWFSMECETQGGLYMCIYKGYVLCLLIPCMHCGWHGVAQSSGEPSFPSVRSHLCHICHSQAAVDNKATKVGRFLIQNPAPELLSSIYCRFKTLSKVGSDFVCFTVSCLRWKEENINYHREYRQCEIFRRNGILSSNRNQYNRWLYSRRLNLNTPNCNLFAKLNLKIVLSWAPFPLLQSQKVASEALCVPCLSFCEQKLVSCATHHSDCWQQGGSHGSVTAGCVTWLILHLSQITQGKS